MKHLGDFDASSVIYGKFTTYRPSTGASFTLGGTPALSVYKDNSTTQSTAGVTLTVDFDSVTGLHHFTIDTSADGSFYAAGSFFDIVITTGTVDSVSVTGSVVGSFTIRKNSALKPTTAGRTLDVSAGGEAGLDWANVGSPTTTVNLSATTIKTATDVETDTADIQSRLPAALVSGRMDSSLGAVAAGVDFSATMKASINTEADAALADVGLTTTITGRIDAAISTRLASASYTAPMDAAGTRTAVGLASANLDTQLGTLATAANLATVAGYLDTEVAAIKSKTDQMVFSTANRLDSQVFGVESAALTAIAASLLAAVVEGTVTVLQSMRLWNSAAGGKASGLATTTAVYRDLADTKDRITATVDADGNRTAITRDLT